MTGTNRIRALGWIPSITAYFILTRVPMSNVGVAATLIITITLIGICHLIANRIAKKETT
jgi:hypothetical protein